MTPLRMALVGAGTWGQAHAMLYREDPRVELVAICDANEAKARALAEKVSVTRVFADHQAMLAGCDCDAVAIVTPDFAHRAIAVDCAEAGKHMIIEKPIATTREDALAMYAAIKRNNVRAMVDFHNRWNPPFALMKSEIERGDIGTPYSAYIRLNDKKWVATTLLPWAAQSSILWFLGSHSVDTLRWIFDDEVTRVYSVSRKGILEQLGVDTVDIYQTILEFSRGGIATMENGWITPDGNPNVNDFKFNVVGTSGSYSLDLSNHNLIAKVTETAQTTPDILVNNFVRERAAGFAYQSVRHFVDRILDGGAFYVTLEDAMRDTLTVLAVMESAKTRMPVDVDLSF